MKGINKHPRPYSTQQRVPVWCRLYERYQCSQKKTSPRDLRGLEYGKKLTFSASLKKEPYQWHKSPNQARGFP